MATASPSTPSSALHRALALHTSLRDFQAGVEDEDASDTFVFAGTEALNEALRLPASDLGDVRMKLAALMAEVGPEGSIDVEDLAFLTRDLSLLLGSVQ